MHDRFFFAVLRSSRERDIMRSWNNYRYVHGKRRDDPILEMSTGDCAISLLLLMWLSYAMRQTGQNCDPGRDRREKQISRGFERCLHKCGKQETNVEGKVRLHSWSRLCDGGTSL